MERKFKVLATIADVHIGNKAISPDEYKYQLQKAVIDPLKDMRILDGIIICGDTLHYQISLNSAYANVYLWFINQLVKIVKSHSRYHDNVFMRILQGTKSHDLDQLDALDEYENDDSIDFKIIRTTYIEVIDGHRYAYIPEEYLDCDPDEYYKEIYEAPKNYFDGIFGHGTVTEYKFFHQEGENLTSKAPLINTQKLMDATIGPILFGHIHTPINIRDQFFYIGSTLRTCHGEEEDKGWNIVCYIKETGNYRVDKIINEHTFNFHHLDINNLFIEKNDVDNIISHIENFVKKKKTDRLSLTFTCVDKQDTSVKIQMLKKYFGKDKNITTNYKILTQEAYDRDLEISSNRDTKPYLKKGLSLEEQIKIWALEKKNIRLKIEDIVKYTTIETLKRKGV